MAHDRSTLFAGVAMRFKSLNRLRGSIAFRITIWYSVIFPLSSALSFGLIYYSLSSYVNRKDREILRAKLEEYVGEYQAGGTKSLDAEIRADRKTDKRISFFVRISGHDNRTLFLSVPDAETAFDYEYLDRKPPRPRFIDLITGRGDFPTEVMSAGLSDGLLLQVGKSIKGRQLLLLSFRETFLVVLIPVVLLGFAGGAFLSHRALRPIHSLIEVVDLIVDTGQVRDRVPENDKLEDLIVLFNRLLERIETLISGMRACLDNVAHDLRTPLTRMRGVIEEALQSDLGKEGLQEALMDCAEESERIFTLVDTLMDISEAETGVMPLFLEEVNLLEMFEDTVQLFDYAADDKKISVSTDCAPDVMIRVDSVRMGQVLANLIDNAVKYTPREGKVIIGGRRIENGVEISVQDTGEGIPIQEIPKIWDRLYRIDKSRSRRGLGLGLSLVKAIVHAHGAEIEVFSEPGKGSRFTIHIPEKSHLC